jgi:hypothetical protein
VNVSLAAAKVAQVAIAETKPVIAQDVIAKIATRTIANARHAIALPEQPANVQAKA